MKKSIMESLVSKAVPEQRTAGKTAADYGTGWGDVHPM